jgi:ABC-type multidrug transport system permease subunit
MMTAIQLSASSQRGASLVTNVVLFPILMLGGAFFPFETMPDWMAAVGRWTPNGFALVEFKWLLAGGLEPKRLALDLLLAAAFGAAFFGYCLSRLGRFARS